MKGIIENPETGETMNPIPLSIRKTIRGLCQVPECDAPIEGTTDFCATHNFERRKAERLANQPKKPIYRIPKTSSKRKEKLKEYTPLKKQYLLDHPECEIKLIGCQAKSIEIHHCSISDKDFLNVNTWKAVCRFCHNKIEFFESAISRREKGLLI